MIQIAAQVNQNKDPFAILAIQVIRRAALDTESQCQKTKSEAQEFFHSEDYHWWLDFISQHIGINLPLDMLPKGVS